MSAKLKENEFKTRFDAGESLESLGFDLDKAVLEGPEVKRVNVDFPDSVVAKLDRHAASMGITRQSLIKVWIFERLKQEAAKPVFGTRMTPLSALWEAPRSEEEIENIRLLYRIISEKPEVSVAELLDRQLSVVEHLKRR